MAGPPFAGEALGRTRIARGRPTDVAPPPEGDWARLLRKAYAIFDDIAERGFGQHRFRLGGGTVLMFHYQHRLSKDIDLFGYDARWLSLVSPRLNEAAAQLASAYSKQANSVKLITAEDDIDFIVAADVLVPTPEPIRRSLAGGHILVEDPAEILAKKLFYRAASLRPRDVYDLSAAIDLSPEAARAAARAAASQSDLLMRRLDELEGADRHSLLKGIIPFPGRSLHHAERMVEKTIVFLRDTWVGSTR